MMQRFPVKDVEPHLLKPGEFGTCHGQWYARTPNGLLADLECHDVTVDAAGLVTVEPSILVKGGDLGQWHGYLEGGVWRECP